MRVSYLYDLPMPSPKAAPIQILNTCRALAAAGIPTTVFTGKRHGDPTACLAFYGLDSHPNLAIRPFFSRLNGGSIRLGRWPVCWPSTMMASRTSSSRAAKPPWRWRHG